MSTMTLRIAMLALHSSPLGRLGTKDTGGMSVYLLEASRELAKYGHQVDIFTRSTMQENLPVITPLPNVRIVHLNVADTFDRSPVDLYDFIDDFVDAIMDFCRQQHLAYHLIHSHYWLSGVVGQSLQAVWQCPHFITFHTTGVAKMSALVNHHEDDIRLTEEARLLDHCDGVIVATAAEGGHLAADHHSIRKKVHVIPCGVNTDHFKPADVTRQQQQDQSSKKARMLMYVGRFDAMKGIDLLLNGFRRLPSTPPVNLTLIGGDGPSTETYEQIINHAQKLGISKRIHMLGQIDHQRMPCYYRTADAVVVTSHYESYGLVILESLSCGTPVVSTPVGAAPHIIQPGVNGYLTDSADSQKFVEAISLTLQLTHQQDPMKISRSVAEFTWSKVARLLLNVYYDKLLKTQST
ncbi:MAG: glycosyltransferase [Planctomycetota bacterium]